MTDAGNYNFASQTLGRPMSAGETAVRPAAAKAAVPPTTAVDPAKFTYGQSTPQTDALLGELMLYVASKSKRQDRFGAALLNKVIWRAEMLCYGELREPLTGAEYVSAEFGPAPRGYRSISDHLIDTGAATEQRGPTGHESECAVLVALRAADLSQLASEQQEFVDQAIHEFDGMTSMRATKAAHNVAWRLGRALGKIPYECHMLVDRPIDDRDREIAKQIAKRLGW